MGNNANEPTLEEIKQSLDIITVAEMYGELVKSGARGNYIYKDNKSISFDENKQIFKDWNGSMDKAGSVLDLVMLMEQKSMTEAIVRLKELSSLDTYTVDPSMQIKRREKAKEKKQVDLNKLQKWGGEELRLVCPHRPFEHKDKDFNTTHFILPQEMQKLFETKQLPAEYKEKLEYIFTHLIGWNKLFRCPSIILYDDNHQIVDLIAYRPNKPDSYENWRGGKYFYKNSHNRGVNFLYPFRKEIEPIIYREGYLIVGEGIKNALNALLYSAPFISLESTSNKMPKTLIAYIKEYIKNGSKIICMFDGDLAGASAFLNFIKSFDKSYIDMIDTFLNNKENKLLPGRSNYDKVLSNTINFIETNTLPLSNFLKFDSNMDFVEYLQAEEK
jgi:hypothetical protein